jgi:hypothetical protein
MTIHGNPVLERILRDAAEQHIDFDDPANRFTLWTDLRHRMQHCGSFRLDNEPWQSAAEHTNLTSPLYIVHAGPQLGVTLFGGGCSA